MNSILFQHISFSQSADYKTQWCDYYKFNSLGQNYYEIIFIQGKNVDETKSDMTRWERDYFLQNTNDIVFGKSLKGVAAMWKIGAFFRSDF